MIKLVVRIDDVHERMNWSNFEFFTDMLSSRGLTAILGVIPKCEDSKLQVAPAASEFWTRLRSLKHAGFKMAQHGYRHVYDTKAPTVLLGNNRSEFAGHSYEEQFRRLSVGKGLLEERGLSIDTFMAPGHSFDKTTIRCLKDLGFKYITDGYDLWPYSVGGIKFLPQLFSSPHGLHAGIYTTCLHLDRLSFRELKDIAQKLYRYDIIPFQEAVNIIPPFYVPQTVTQCLSRSFVSGYRSLTSKVRN